MAVISLILALASCAILGIHAELDLHNVRFQPNVYCPLAKYTDFKSCIGLTLPYCTSDLACPDSQLCCFNGCNYSCMDKATPEEVYIRLYHTESTLTEEEKKLMQKIRDEQFSNLSSPEKIIELIKQRRLLAERNQTTQPGGTTA